MDKKAIQNQLSNLPYKRDLTRKHYFNPAIALILKSDKKALLLENIDYWCEENRVKQNPKALKGGKYWVYQSARKFAERFYYLKPASIHRWLMELESEGWIIVERSGQGKIMPNWYRPSKNYFELKRLVNIQAAKNALRLAEGSQEIENPEQPSGTPKEEKATSGSPKITQKLVSQNEIPEHGLVSQNEILVSQNEILNNKEKSKEEIKSKEVASCEETFSSSAFFKPFSKEDQLRKQNDFSNLRRAIGQVTSSKNPYLYSLCKKMGSIDQVRIMLFDKCIEVGYNFENKNLLAGYLKAILLERIKEKSATEKITEEEKKFIKVFESQFKKEMSTNQLLKLREKLKEKEKLIDLHTWRKSVNVVKRNEPESFWNVATIFKNLQTKIMPYEMG